MKPENVTCPNCGGPMAREAALKLAETWRRRAREQGAIYAQGIHECADELTALFSLGTPQEKP